MKKPHHIQRFSSFIQDELALFLREAFYDTEEIFVSITRVDPARSAGSVNVWVSVWPDEKRAYVAKKLSLLENKAKAYLAGRLNRKYPISVHFYVIGAT